MLMLLFIFNANSVLNGNNLHRLTLQVVGFALRNTDLPQRFLQDEGKKCTFVFSTFVYK